MENIVEEIIEVFKESFGKDRITIERESGATRIYVEFEDFYITNDKGNKYLIKGFIGRYSLDFKGNLIAHKYSRSCLTKKEVIKGYIHSHVNTFYIKENNGSFYIPYNSFCFGKDPLITVSILNIAAAIKENNKQQILDSYLVFIETIKEVICYESEKGGPYFKFNNLTEYIGKSYKNIFIDKLSFFQNTNLLKYYQKEVNFTRELIHIVYSKFKQDKKIRALQDIIYIYTTLSEDILNKIPGIDNRCISNCEIKYNTNTIVVSEKPLAVSLNGIHYYTGEKYKPITIIEDNNTSCNKIILPEILNALLAICYHKYSYELTKKLQDNNIRTSTE